MHSRGDDDTQGNHNRDSMNRSKDSTAHNTPSSKYLSNRHEATWCSKAPFDLSQ
jgi:hypothetical protein